MTQECPIHDNSFPVIIILFRVTRNWLNCFRGKTLLPAPGGGRICRNISVQPTKLALLLEMMEMTLMEHILVVPLEDGIMGVTIAATTSEHPSVMSAAIWKKPHL